jgi:YbbR domain-containing protein
VTRLIGVIVHNWPLKLAAIGLATLLYGGLVLSQNATTFSEGVIPVEVRNQPPDTYLLTTIEPVTEVRYFSASGIRPITSSFEAWIDLGSVDPGGGPVTVPIQVRSIDARINVIGYSPDSATVTLDPIATKQVPVVVRYEPPPAGLETGATEVEPAIVTVSGPASVVEQVTAAQADVVVQSSGISIDQDVQLTAVDAVGNAVNPVNVEPRDVRVRIPVFADLRSKTLTVIPDVTGTPAPGFEISSVSVEPLIVTVEGDAEQLADLVSLDTAPVSINGASSGFTAAAALVLPSGVVALGADTVEVTVEFRAVTATRSFEVGLRLLGARATLDYTIDADRVIVTLGGSIADLDRLSGATLVADLDVSELGPGTAPVPVTMEPPAGLTLVSSSPAEVGVTVTPSAAEATPPASPAASPGASEPAESPAVGG